MTYIMQYLVGWINGAATRTVHDDGLQFFIVLEIMDPSDQNLPSRLYQILYAYSSYFSTSVGPSGPPNPLTVVLTGGSQNFIAWCQNQGLNVNELAIQEQHDYGPGEIVNLSTQPFGWELFKRNDQFGHVNSCHLTDKVNVRVWYGDKNLDHNDVVEIMASGVDAQNTRDTDIDVTLQAMQDQQPLGSSPALVVRGGQALITWASDNYYLYAAIGSMSTSGLVFTRQLNLYAFLADQPSATVPSAAIAPDGTIVIVYQRVYGGVPTSHLAYVAGRFTSADRFITFAGGQRDITLRDGARIGFNPSVAIGPDKRVIVAYEGTSRPRLFYVSGELAESGFGPSQFTIEGEEHCLTDEAGQRGYTVRGYTPSVAFDDSGSLIMVYRGTDSNDNLCYLTGTVDSNTANIDITHTNSLTQDDHRRGTRPSVAIRSTDHQVAIAYEGTSHPKLWYTTGQLDASGRIQNAAEHELTIEDQDHNPIHQKGDRPTIVFGQGDAGAILYHGTSEDKLWYVLGSWSPAGELVGPENMLNMALGESARTT